jgi:hypothetical protein
MVFSYRDIGKRRAPDGHMAETAQRIALEPIFVRTADDPQSGKGYGSQKNHDALKRFGSPNLAAARGIAKRRAQTMQTAA